MAARKPRLCANLGFAQRDLLGKFQGLQAGNKFACLDCFALRYRARLNPSRNPKADLAPFVP